MRAMTAAHYVLVIEDNAMNADVLKENLVDAGYRFALAVNGAAGVALANDLLPDIILMDVNLPILDGLSATRLLKKNSTTQGIPIVALTARAMSGDREICLAAGCDDYVSKPVDIDLLLAKMQHHLDSRPPSFVEMIRRQRVEAENRARDADDPLSLQPGMAPHEYEAEFANLNRTIERSEADLRLAQLRVSELDDTLGEREQQIAALIADRDGARRELERQGARILELAAERDRVVAERDTLRTQRDALQHERDALIVPIAPPATVTTPPPRLVVNSVPPDDVAQVVTDDQAKANRRLRKLAQQLELSQERVRELQAQLDGLPPDLKTLHAQHESLRKAFVQLHRSVVKSAEEALHQVAFGRSSG
ncbi:MAG: response regulator [Myxococcota bacterium]